MTPYKVKLCLSATIKVITKFTARSKKVDIQYISFFIVHSMTDHHLKISNKLRATKKSFNCVKAENSQGKGLRGCYHVRNWLVSKFITQNHIFAFFLLQNGHFHNYISCKKKLRKIFWQKKFETNRYQGHKTTMRRSKGVLCT